MQIKFGVQKIYKRKLFKDIIVQKQEGMKQNKEGTDIEKNVMKRVQFRCAQNGQRATEFSIFGEGIYQTGVSKSWNKLEDVAGMTWMFFDEKILCLGI